MTTSHIEDHLLSALYEAFFRGEGTVSLGEVCGHVSRDECIRAADRLDERGLVRLRTTGPTYRITATGILDAEERGIAPRSLHGEATALRAGILGHLADLHDSEGRYASRHVTQIARALNSSDVMTGQTIVFLEELGFVSWAAVGHAAITPQGYESALLQRFQSDLVSRFAALSRLPPQARGRQFNRFVAEVVESHGWRPEPEVRRSHEEMDVVISKAREFYLVECKWEADPIEASVVRELYGKISNRTGMTGLLASMSGFTQGAVDQVREYMNQKLVLLFGPRDVRALVDHSQELDALLDLKHRDLVMRAIVTWE